MFHQICTSKRTGEPLKTFTTEQAALDQVTYVRQRYGNEQVPYRCKNCGCWHLSPIERQTPSHLGCGCRDEMGRIKQCYENRLAAEKRKMIIQRERGEILYIYPCPLGLGWHLTHKNY